MLHAKTSEIHHNQEENNEARSKSSIAVVPIATPYSGWPRSYHNNNYQYSQIPG